MPEAAATPAPAGAQGPAPGAPQRPSTPAALPGSPLEAPLGPALDAPQGSSREALQGPPPENQGTLRRLRGMLLQSVPLPKRSLPAAGLPLAIAAETAACLQLSAHAPAALLCH